MSFSFSNFLQQQDWCEHSLKLHDTDRRQIERALNREGHGGIEDLRALLSPLAEKSYLEEMACLSRSLTRKRFGKAIRLFAPLYLSNE